MTPTITINSATTNNIFQKLDQPESAATRIAAKVLGMGREQSAMIPTITISRPDAATREWACMERDSALWTCVGRRKDLHGGFIYDFELNEGYGFRAGLTPEEEKQYTDAAEKKNSEIFPAIEPDRNIVHRLIQEFQNRFEWVAQLGYDFKVDSTSATMSLPDKEALEARFKILQQNHPLLRFLAVKDSDGIASDMDFVRAYFEKNDVLLSSGREFVHDHIAHVLPTLQCMLSDPAEYARVRKQLAKIAQDIYDDIAKVEQAMRNGNPVLTAKEIKLVKIVAGIFVDGHLWAVRDLSTLEPFIASNRYGYDSRHTGFISILETADYRNFWSRKFPGERLNVPAITDVWVKIRFFNFENELKAAQGDRQKIREAFERRQITDANQGSMMGYTVSNGYTEIVRALKESFTKKEFSWALIRAAGKGHLEIVRALLANRRITDEDRFLALIEAATKGHLEIVRVLLASGPIEDEARGEAVTRAANEGHLEIVRVLLASGKIPDEERQRAIRVAIRCNQPEIAKELQSIYKQ